MTRAVMHLGASEAGLAVAVEFASATTQLGARLHRRHITKAEFIARQDQLLLGAMEALASRPT